MHTRYMEWSRYLYLASIVLALVMVVPTVWFPFQLLKIAVFATCLLASAVLFVMGGGARDLMESHGLRGALLVSLLPLSYLLSALYSTDKSVAFMGFALEPDTVLFSVLLFVAFMLGFALFRTLRTVRQMLTTLVVALSVVAVFQAVSVLFGAIPFEAFADRSTNLVGKWNDFGIVGGLLLLVILACIEFAPLSRLYSTLLYVAGFALLVLLVLINFSLVWWFVLAGALGVGLVSFLSARSAARERGESGGRVPVPPIVLAVLAMAFLIWGAAFNVQVANVFPVSSLEVRPSYTTTIQVVNAARGSDPLRFLVGTGPNTFGAAWLVHKPAEVNQSQFWNLDFNVGFSTILTAFGTVGLLGALAWLLPFLLVLAGVLRALRLKLVSRDDRLVVICLVLCVLILAGSILLYVPSANVLALAVALSGATFGFLWRQGQSSKEDIHSRTSRLLGMILVVVLVVLVALSATLSVRRLVAEAYLGRAGQALAEGNVDDALSYSARARGVEETGNILRFSATAGAAKLQQLASLENPPAGVQQEFSQILEQALATGARAGAMHPKDYRPMFILAQIYDFLTQLGVDGADVQARAGYAAARALNPTNPQIPLLSARFEASRGDNEATGRELQAALTLKPNYTDAMLFMTQLAVAQNDLQSAVQSAQAAVQSAPGVPSLWFQLGLLLYSGGDTQNAVPILEQALTLQPDYANAQYFLGLSYYLQGRAPDAIRQFEELARTNPDNAEVALVLANMREGKEAFDGATPPADTPPEERDSAPVAQ